MWALILVSALLNLIFADLVFVQELFRHGARYPLSPNDKDGTAYAKVDNMAGQLTSEGKRMHYLLGKQLYADYWNQLGLNSTYNSSFVYIKSTNVNRTLESGESQFLGWMENLDALELNSVEAQLAIPPWDNGDFNRSVGPVFPNSPKFKPMAIHSEKQGSNALNQGDYLLAYSYSNCPNAVRWAREGLNSQLYMNVTKMQRVKQALKAMQQALNDTIDMEKSAMYFENFQCSKHLDKPYNAVFDGQYLNDYKFMQSFVKYSQLTTSELQVNATVTGFFNATLNNMRKIIANKQKQKLVLYSAHDLTIVVVLAGLRLGSRECALNHYLNPSEPTDCVYEYPDFASSLIFEVHLNNSAYSVKLRYNGQYLKMPFCDAMECPFEQFQRHLSGTLRPGFFDDCGVAPFPSEGKQTTLIVANAVIGAFLLGAVAYEIYLFTRKRSKSSKASTAGYLNQADEVE